MAKTSYHQHDKTPRMDHDHYPAGSMAEMILDRCTRKDALMKLRIFSRIAMRTPPPSDARGHMLWWWEFRVKVRGRVIITAYQGGRGSAYLECDVLN